MASSAVVESAVMSAAMPPRRATRGVADSASMVPSNCREPIHRAGPATSKDIRVTGERPTATVPL